MKCICRKEADKSIRFDYTFQYKKKRSQSLYCVDLTNVFKQYSIYSLCDVQQKKNTIHARQHLINYQTAFLFGECNPKRSILKKPLTEFKLKTIVESHIDTICVFVFLISIRLNLRYCFH